MTINELMTLITRSIQIPKTINQKRSTINQISTFTMKCQQWDMGMVSHFFGYTCME